jgi:hypothetical protein
MHFLKTKHAGFFTRLMMCGFWRTRIRRMTAATNPVIQLSFSRIFLLSAIKNGTIPWTPFGGSTAFTGKIYGQKTHPEGCRGVPDLVVEILSPATTKHDTEVKFKIYENAGVREYWIVDPEAETVIVYNMKDGIYSGETFAGAVFVPSKILSGCVIDMEKVFRQAKE